MSRIAKFILEFDPGFYRRYYPDLRDLSVFGLLRHYVRHGESEARFPSYSRAKCNLERRYGPLPVDFAAGVYALFNPDLQRVYSDDRQLTLHYLERGRAEGRRHGPAQAGQPLWQAFFRSADYLAASEGTPPRPTSRAAALAEFSDQGIANLAPVANCLTFDPDFYRATYAHDDPRSDADLYRGWLDGGWARAEAPNEAKALDPYVGDGRLPTEFDWERYRTGLPATTASSLRSRVDVVRHLFDSDDLPATAGPVGRDLDLLIAGYRFRQQRLSAAARLYERSLAATGALPTRDLHRLAEVRRLEGNRPEALVKFIEAGRRRDASVWSIVRAVDLQAQAGRFEEAFGELATQRARFDAFAVFRATISRTIDAFHAYTIEQAAGLYRCRSRKAADDLLLAGLQKTRSVLEALEAAPTPLPRRTGPIVLVANMALPQCKHYRVDQKVEQIRLAGEPIVALDVDNISACRDALLDARLVIFYRLPANPNVLRLIRDATALGLPTFYDIDDLIFDKAHYPEAQASYGGLIGDEDYIGLLSDAPMHRFAMSLCQTGVASTPPLAAHVATVVTSGTCHLWPNLLDVDRWDDETHFSRSLDPQQVTILYGSGTKAHTHDFCELVAPALATVLDTCPAAMLVVVGHVVLGPEFVRFGDRVQQFALVPFAQYEALLAQADIALGMLHPSVVADCKSEIKWLEAAALAIPAIVTPTEANRLALTDGHDVLFATSEEEWTDRLLALVQQPLLRAKIGRAARATAHARFGRQTGGRVLQDVLNSLPTPNELQDQGLRRAKRVLIVNVFFPPQSFGGTTRVVAGTVEHADADIQFCVFTTDQGASEAGHLRYDSYRGVPVVRLAVDEGKADSDITSEGANSDAFERLLDVWRPDLVHFHCIQRLGPGLVAIAAAREIPYLITVHDGWWISRHQFLIDEDGFPVTLASLVQSHKSAPDEVSDATRRQILMPLMRSAEAVIGVSDSFAGLHRSLGLTNVIALPNGVSSDAAFRHMPRGDGRVRLGHLGGRTLEKGAALIEGVLRSSRFLNLDLLMVDPRLERGERIETVWGTTPVTLVGPEPQDEVGKVYGSIDVLLAPSIWPESFGLVAREALSGGLWVVVSDRGALSESVTEDVNGFVIDVTDGSGLRAILGQMDADPGRFAAGTRGATAKIRSAEDHAQETSALYRRLLMQQGPIDLKA